MPKKNIILVIISLLSVIIVFFAYNFLTSQNSGVPNITQTKKGPVEVTLEFWGVWDNSDSWQSIIDKFEKETHNWNGQEVKVKVNYTKKDIAAYEADLKNSYDEKKSPSIFIINNYWLSKYADKLEPLSANTADIQEYDLINYDDLEKIFPPYLLQDAYYKDKGMVALPIYSDSLALYYNKDLFQKAGIQNPPATWDELKTDVKKLTVLEKKNAIKQSGVAMGGGNGVSRSCDILALLTMQGGGKMIDAQSNIDFNKKINVKTSAGAQEREPGLTAIQFYMDFSDPTKEIYTWNNSLTNSTKDFADGKVAMMFGYSYQKANLLALKPELNYGIAPIPQLPNSTPMNISNIWMPAVSNQDSCNVKGDDTGSIDCAQVAWSFLSFANQKENISEYLNTTGKASARIDLIQEQLGKDDNVSAFAKQAGLARSYGKFDDRIDGILTNMLDQIYADRSNWRAKADEAAAKIEELKNNTK